MEEGERLMGRTPVLLQLFTSREDNPAATEILAVGQPLREV
jgi:hypothetical protein